ncbi:MAG: excinuclease ABC subunit UvrC [Alphaproteobacteria bacterium]|nr:MAG: excinuclease ABC subunit UvrC [Alphaproteobacteria bacterium]
MSLPSYERGAALLRGKLAVLPDAPGVYRMLDASGAALYVGKARNIRRRVAQYAQVARLPIRLRRMLARLADVEIVITRSEAEALLLEASLIRREQPPFNIMLRDDKTYPSLLLTRDHPFPRLLRHRGAHTVKGWYFGPFASAGAVHETLMALQRGFLLRNCTDSMFAQRTRPCLQYHIHRCTAPCVGKISQTEYAGQVEGARRFLTGRSTQIQEQLAARMQAASQILDYETAARLRDRLRALAAVQTVQGVSLPGLGDADVMAAHTEDRQSVVQVHVLRGGHTFGTRSHRLRHEAGQSASEVLASFIGQFYADKDVPPLILLTPLPADAPFLEEALTQKSGRSVRLESPQQGPRRRLVEAALHNAREALARHLAETGVQAGLLQQVAEAFHLPAPPRRIEVYDNSHTGGRSAMGAMIVAGAEGLDKKSWRRFVIRDDIAPGDDPAMMREVMRRRLLRLREALAAGEATQRPDLIILDGGITQLNAAYGLASELGFADLAFVGMAKGEDRNAGRERYFLPGQAEPVILPEGSAVAFFLQRLRDEAHRFAINSHRAKREADLLRSPLDDIPGVGPARRRALLQHFGSARAISAAAPEDLQRVSGISLRLARVILDRLG